MSRVAAEFVRAGHRMESRRILLVLSGWIHPPYRGRVLLKQALAQLPGLSFDEVSTLPAALQRPLAGYAAVVLYYHHRNHTLAEEQLAAFRSFVADGGGVLAVHSATASYKPCAGYCEVLGGRFAGHGRVGPMELRPVQQQDPIFSGISAFALNDELYVHEVQPDIRVHFDASYQGKAVPVVWTREMQSGRVCYVSPGHRAASLGNSALQEILRRGLLWVCRRAAVG